ncbi:unnamed protein product, partial [Mesorhabditis belari]|uniref:Neurotransmitter-gated ion-channel ligand-binding domain-containing protein n=1 Tax=Mesorhabditis belari TaxID=2138241 RepID=A0AAF3FN73_9BILA
MNILRLVLLLLFNGFICINCNKYANQLYEDLLYFYNKNVRPVKNATQPVLVKFGAALIRIIDVYLKEALMSLNVRVSLDLTVNE